MFKKLTFVARCVHFSVQQYAMSGEIDLVERSVMVMFITYLCSVFSSLHLLHYIDKYMTNQLIA